VGTRDGQISVFGTEFGVEVDRQGNSSSYVFDGYVRVQAADDAGNAADVGQVLHANEALRMERQGGRIRAVRCDWTGATDFRRHLSRRTSIRLFNTGQTAEEGQEDPHWQIVAQSDTPDFQPKQAVVYHASPNWLPNLPSQCQWISSVEPPLAVRNGVTYTFRTTFSLEGFQPETCVLRGLFAADNHVRAIRINGREVPVPKHEATAPFTFMNRFSIDQGFVEGTNILEFDVDNEVPIGELPVSSMGLRVILEASAVQNANRERS